MHARLLAAVFSHLDQLDDEAFLGLLAPDDPRHFLGFTLCTSVAASPLYLPRPTASAKHFAIYVDPRRLPGRQVISDRVKFFMGRTATRC